MGALPRLELICFGSPTATVDGRVAPPEVLWRKHLALLIYLALSPGHRRSRDHVLGLFWAEKPQARARHSLNESVLRLRRCLGSERLRSEGDALVLADDGLKVDALQFAAAAGRAPDEALPLLRGDFLEGFYVEEAPAFDEWLTVERRRYQALAADALVASGEDRLARGRFAEAGDVARRALALAPYSEPATRLLMRACAMAGDSTTALAAYRAFAGRLEGDLGERPGKTLSALVERIRSQTWRPAAPGEAAREPPLVGREGAIRQAFETVAQGLVQGGGPRVLVITGAPGMGRTRLLAECLRRLTLEGARVALARPLESDQDAPWSALRRLFRAGLSDAPGLPAARPGTLAALAGLVPELADRYAPRTVRDVADLAAVLTDVLATVAEEAPVAIALDDAHWADGASVGAIGSAVAALRGPRVVLALTVATGIGDPPRELIALQGDVGRGLPGMSVRLDPLGEAEMRALVGALAPWCRGDAERDRLARRLVVETAGNPFFAVTLLGALERATTLRPDLTMWPPPHGTLDAPLPFSVPNLVRFAVAMRVKELEPDEEAVLRAASVCGQALDLELVALLAERSPADVERSLPAFERRHLVSFDGHRYAFTAPLVAEAVLSECLTRGERRRLERRAIDALAGRADLESRVRRVELLAHVEAGAEAYALALAAARDALEIGAVRVARRCVAAAERLSRTAGADRAELDALLARL